MNPALLGAVFLASAAGSLPSLAVTYVASAAWIDSIMLRASLRFWSSASARRTPAGFSSKDSSNSTVTMR